MIGIIVTGHGNFASGLISSMDLIAGSQENIIDVNFTQEDNTKTLEEKMVSAINNLGKDIIILCDLAGGSPFKVAVTLSCSSFEDKNIHVLSGVNLGMLLEVVLSRDEMNVNELLKFACEAGKRSIKTFEMCEEKEDEIEEGFGI